MPDGRGAQQFVVIDDFTPGVQSFSRGGGFLPTYPLVKGSAAQAYRCYALPGVGLCPLPSYTSSGATAPTPAAGITLMSSITSLGAYWQAGNEFLIYATIDWNSATPATEFKIWTATYTQNTNSWVNTGPVYSSTFPALATMPLNNLTTAFTNNAGAYQNVAVIADPLGAVGSVKWVTVPSWNSGAAYLTGTFTVGNNGLTAQSFIQSGRIGFIATVGTSSTIGSAGVFLSNVEQPANWSTPNFYSPGASNLIGSWGSINAGELVIIKQGQGGALVYGDAAYPQQVVNLPGIVGTGQAVGPGASTPIGLVYVTDYDGAYVWNGGSTSQKLSMQIPDDSFVRQIPSAYAYNGGCQTHHDTWGSWVMFANNWMYDCLTNAWWQVENPSTLNFQVHTSSHMSTRWFYSSTGYSQNGGTPVTIYQWDKTKPASSWYWLSNPVAPPTPGFLATLNTVEIVASNPTATPATITVTPQPAAGQTPVGGNQAQQATFTIPAYTSGYRVSSSLGYHDWNVQVAVTASNSSGSNEAPILHRLMVGYEQSQTSGSGA